MLILIEPIITDATQQFILKLIFFLQLKIITISCCYRIYEFQSLEIITIFRLVGQLGNLA